VVEGHAADEQNGTISTSGTATRRARGANACRTDAYAWSRMKRWRVGSRRRARRVNVVTNGSATPSVIGSRRSRSVPDRPPLEGWHHVVRLAQGGAPSAQ
jgi:hypothetical protein